MTDEQVGRAIRAVRIRKGWRQVDVATAARVSQQTVSRIERGVHDGVPLGTLRRVAGAVGVRVSIVARWDGAALDRLLSARHSAMHEEVARLFAGLPGWVTAPEVTFAIYGERGAIDILAWHAPTRSLLVIELKTEIVDAQETVATLDRKVRLASRIAGERGWHPDSVSAWLVVAESPTNRRRFGRHRAMLRSAYPDDGRKVARWLLAPCGRLRALSFLSSTRDLGAGRGMAPVHRVRRRRGPGVRAGNA